VRSSVSCGTTLHSICVGTGQTANGYLCRNGCFSLSGGSGETIWALTITGAIAAMTLFAASAAQQIVGRKA
jgi:hypothetical protein